MTEHKFEQFEGLIPPGIIELTIVAANSIIIGGLIWKIISKCDYDKDFKEVYNFCSKKLGVDKNELTCIKLKHRNETLIELMNLNNNKIYVFNVSKGGKVEKFNIRKEGSFS